MRSKKDLGGFSIQNILQCKYRHKKSIQSFLRSAPRLASTERPRLFYDIFDNLLGRSQIASNAVNSVLRKKNYSRVYLKVSPCIDRNVNLCHVENIVISRWKKTWAKLIFLVRKGALHELILLIFYWFLMPFQSWAFMKLKTWK